MFMTVNIIQLFRASLTTKSSSFRRVFSRPYSDLVTHTMDPDKPKLAEWHKPQGSAAPKLKLYNTLTRTKTDFIPMNGNQVTWYSCGPTVYDASHMGHARNYVTIDINRRILSDYFGYDVLFVQNVTNIDDKIIIGARQNHLFEQFSAKAKADGPHASKVLADRVLKDTVSFGESKLPGAPVAEGLEAFTKWADQVPAEEKAKEAKFSLYVNSITAALQAVAHHSSLPIEDFLAKAKAMLVVSLDTELGASVTDHKIFNDLASKWENEYDNDMRILNVRPADVTTRVSEYVPDIVEFVETIISNGYGYPTTDGSVYFDTVKFEADGHSYAKLQPWNKGQAKLIAEGEGDLSLGLAGKKSPNDFALWKASKPGEPFWPSPWGEGRPGWHIECSVMATAILGDQIDIHSGGIDLAFPHHDNELAQSEACSGKHQWINYFLHTGHLHIAGQKMSKSLKNFITIKESLKTYTPRQLRLAFAMQQWNQQFDFKPALPEVKSVESSLNNFFAAVRALIREEATAVASGKVISKKPGKVELQLYKELSIAQTAVHEAFADNLSVPQAIAAISDLVQKANLYILESKTEVKSEVLSSIVRWITKILQIIGFEPNSDGLGWASSGNSASAGGKEEIALPFVQILSNFRDEVREKAIAKAPYTDFLEATDRLRDRELLELGVSLDDRSDGRGALAKFIDSEEQQKLIQQRDEKEQREKLKAQKKAEAAKAEEAKRLEKLEKAKISPLDMFRNTPEGYSQFDEKGLPTHDKDGEPLSKSMAKKLAKLHGAQTKLHEEYLASQK